jgi:photosystem II stability/assembly factor-like uncharacterized protein
MKRLAYVLACAVLMSVSLGRVESQRLQSVALDALKWRNISDAHVGTRINAIAVPVLHENGTTRAGRIIYLASPGGLYKTSDWGTTWDVVTDGLPDSAVSAVDVAKSDPNTVWIGTGDFLMSFHREVIGSGVYKSIDAGKHWQFSGLPNSVFIGKIAIDPTNTDVVYAGVLGSRWKPSTERGVYRTQDGGKTWKRVAYAGPWAGASDIEIDPTNPKIIFATMWQYGDEGGAWTPYGPESQILRSTDGGQTWERLRGGLPQGNLGRMAIAISPANHHRIYALVDDRDIVTMTKLDGIHSVRQPGANIIYISDDGGDTWRKGHKSDDYSSEYYGRIVADTANQNRVYLIAGDLLTSKDGGKTFPDTFDMSKGIRYLYTHGCDLDDHDVWVDPLDATHLLCGGDAGLDESRDAGSTWHHFGNIPGGLYYTIATDYARPFYHIYGTLQDQGVEGVAVRTRGSGIAPSDWISTEGTEGSGLSTDRFRPDTVYAYTLATVAGGFFANLVSRYDLRHDEAQDISPPDTLVQRETEILHNQPILVSSIRKNVVYTGVAHLYRSTNGGKSWTRISGDVRRSLPRVITIMGVQRPRHIMERDAIRAIAESPRNGNVIWFGTEYGNLFVTRNYGKSWTRITLPSKIAPNDGVIAQIVPSRVADGSAYVLTNDIGHGNFAPYILRTADFGRTWIRVTDGLPATAAAWAATEYPQNPNVLFAGTDKGLYYTVNRGARWMPLRNNAPSIRVTGVLVQPQQKDLVICTWGRGVYVIDDISPIATLASVMSAKLPHLFPMRAEVRFLHPVGFYSSIMDLVEQYVSPNPPYGAPVTYWLPQNLVAGTVRLQFTQHGHTIDTMGVPTEVGLHRVYWPLQARVPVSSKSTMSIALPPGTYEARLVVGHTVAPGVAFRIESDPRSGLTQAEYQTQYKTLLSIARLELQAYRILAHVKQLQKSVPTTAAAQRRRLQAVYANFEPPTVGYDALDGLSTPPGLVAQLQDIAQAVNESTTVPTLTQQAAVQRIAATLDSLQRAIASITTRQ